MREKGKEIGRFGPWEGRKQGSALNDWEGGHNKKDKLRYIKRR